MVRVTNDNSAIGDWYGSSLVEVQEYRTLTDTNRISTDVTHAFRTNCMLTDKDGTSNGRLCPVEIFEHAQNFPTEGPDIADHGEDSPD